MKENEIKKLKNLVDILVKNPDLWSQVDSQLIKVGKDWADKVSSSINIRKNLILKNISNNGNSLKSLSDELRNDKEIVMAAVKKNGEAFQYASDELRKDKTFILNIVCHNVRACDYSLLEGYQNFDEIVKKEGEPFLFSCWNNLSPPIRLKVASHPNFVPTKDQISIGLKDEFEPVAKIYRKRMHYWKAIEHNYLPTLAQIKKGLENFDEEVKQVYQTRQDEWLAKIGENELHKTIVIK